MRTMNCKVSNRGGDLEFEGASPTKPFDVCSVFRKHRLVLGALSETRWKGCGTLRADEFLFLFSGLPEEAPVSLYGVSFVLGPSMQAAWRAAGSHVVYHSERLMKIKLLIKGRVFHVISVYAPTFRAKDEEKEKFYADLHALCAECKAGEELIVMGDFNARVGVRNTATGDTEVEGQDGDDRSLGDFGLPELSDNGRLLLDFCRSYGAKSLRVMSTKYKHKQYGTWQHNRTKQWHQIDHVLSKARTALLFRGVRRMPGLDFDSDHRLVRVSLHVMRVGKQPQGKNHGVQRDTRQRMPRLRVDKLQKPEVVESINDAFGELVEDAQAQDYAAWARGLRIICEQVLGEVDTVWRPEWQQAHSAELEQLAAVKHAAFLRKGEGPERLAEYKRICKANKRRVKQLLNKWWADTADHIQEAVDRKEPNHQYKGYQQLRRVFDTGRRAPCRIKDRTGQALNTRPERVQRWREHFSELLNVPTTVEAERLDTPQPVATNESLAAVSSFAEVMVATKSLNSGKAAGPDGIPAEVLKVLRPEHLRSLREIICRVWTGLEPMPQEWKDAYLVPIPKKGDRTKCGKWRGILLTSVPGKIFAKILNGRLVGHFENNGVLPESQCGFRSGRGTADMIYTLRMAIELGHVKKIPLYALFVDLMKAYDSVSRQGLWEILDTKGVPAHVVTLIQQ